MSDSRDFIVGRKIRVALVGCGRIAQRHLEAIAAHRERLELTAVCDADRAALEAAVARTGVRGFASLGALLSQSDADVVVLCTPSGQHSAADRADRRGRASCHHGKADGDTLGGRQAHGRGLRCRQRAPVRRQAEPPQRHPATAQAAVDQKRFGRIYMVNLNVFWTPSAELLRQRQVARHLGVRRRRAHEPGEPLRGPGRLADRPGRERAGLHGHAGAQHPGRGHRRSSAIRWRSGALGSINVTMLAYPKNSRARSRCSARHGTVRIGGVAVNEIQHWEFADPARQTTPRSPKPATPPRPSTASAIRSTTTTSSAPCVARSSRRPMVAKACARSRCSSPAICRRATGAAWRCRWSTETHDHDPSDGHRRRRAPRSAMARGSGTGCTSARARALARAARSDRTSSSAIASSSAATSRSRTTCPCTTTSP